MSRLVSRILLSIFMFPLATVFYILVFTIAEETSRGSSFASREIDMFMASSVLTWLVVAVYWCLLWRSAVSWNSFRIGMTLLAALAAALVGSVAGSFTYSFLGRGDASFGVFLGGVLAIILWLIATVFIWRETAAERAERARASGKSAVTCPSCGYNLTGLSESRCPECGSKFTLDQLLAMQRDTGREIE